MKTKLVVALGLSVLATSAFASKARLQALGEDANGSFYINDNRNIFLNAAHVNSYKDFVTFETGNTTADAGDDSAAAPRPEGGVYFGHGSMVYGVHLGNESNSSNLLRNYAGVNTEQNNLDLFVGGDAGVKWGANLTYSSTHEGAQAGSGTDSEKLARVRLGAVSGAIEGFVNMDLTNKSAVNNEDVAAIDSDFEGGTSYKIGAVYSMNAYKFFFESSAQKGSDEIAETDAEYKVFRLGAGRTSKINDKAVLFTKFQYVMTTENGEDNGNAVLQTDGEAKETTNLPLTIGLEYDAASWLVLRASVSQSIYSNVSVKDTSDEVLEDTTTANLGASLKFGELTVDGVIGNSKVADADLGENANGTLRTDTLMSRVSVSYNW